MLFVDSQLHYRKWMTTTKPTVENESSSLVPCPSTNRNQSPSDHQGQQVPGAAGHFQYQPDEINVKVVNDKVAISAKHEAKSDGVYEYHEMTRTFDLPEGVDPESVTSRLSTNGQLTIEAPMKPANESSTERIILFKFQRIAANRKF
ncbi:hypothetical protein CEXT_797321 [Caerostris extrusa]|uniref:SHSP domain-containing protein n=1 Tax=Caerostris extrusa TaxID=172846 RepID=A0AAV4R9F5_CAEEX|nr:hypothetical protein CEXT_797321 [Caerostris extrusa]